MSQFLGNLHPLSRSRSSCSSGATSSGQPPAPSIVVPTPAAIVTPSLDGAGSLPLVSNHGHRVQEDVVPTSESLEIPPLNG